MNLRTCLLLGLLTLTGCGSDFSTVPVSGVVTLDNQPVAGAGVVYIPDQPGPTASATTDAEGRYTLMTGKLKGAGIGKYRITVFKEETSGIKVGEDGLEAPGGKVVVKRGVPAIYSDPATSGLKMTIDAARNDADLKLLSK